MYALYHSCVLLVELQFVESESTKLNKINLMSETEVSIYVEPNLFWISFPRNFKRTNFQQVIYLHSFWLASRHSEVNLMT